ncbi:MAG: ABC transporter permease, partial [Acidimicrobiia bacterium]
MSTLSTKRRRDIGRQKWQFIAVLVTVVLGVMLFAASFNAYLNLGSSLEGTYERLAMADMTVVGADGGFVDTASSIEGVSTAIERRQADVPAEAGDYTFVGRIIAMPPDGQPAVNMVDIEQGSYLDPNDSSKVLVETHMAADFELTVGDTIVIAGQDVEVAGIAVSPEYLWPAKDAQNLFTPPKTFGVIFVAEAILDGIDNPTIVDEVLVLYGSDADVEATDAAVESEAEAANASSVQTLVDQPSNSSINLEISGLRTMAIAFPLLFLAAAGMAIYVVITRMVYSQRGVIGTLRASGFSSKTLSRHYLSYGLGVGVIGAAIGVAIGAIMGRGLTAIYTEVFDIPDLVAELHLPTIAMALVFGAVAGSLAAVPPSRAVARMAPAEAMRGDAPEARGKQSIFEKLIPPLRHAPVRWRLTLRGIGRSKRRSFTLVLGVVLALTLIIAAWGMLDTMLLAFDKQFNEVALEDASVAFNTQVGQAQLDDIEAIGGVRRAEAVIGLSATLRSSTGSYATLLEGYEANTEVHGFAEPLPASGVVLGQAIEGLLEISIGDSVVIEFPALETEIHATIEGFVDEPLGSFAYMRSDALEASLAAADPPITADVLAQPSFTTSKVLFDDGADTTGVLADIEALDDVAVVLDEGQIRELLEEFQQFF